ncbi:hypothetical protein GCM10009579_63830 [Streptomyces javensis]|uniref:Uncharacterized protein n=1 Tax=Streptomyces javensis TaxID=114698 RepID=A0ABN1X7N0_9ACTN
MHSAQQNKMGWYIGGMAATVVTLTGGKDPLQSARGSCSKAAPAAPAASWRTTNTAADRLARSAGTSRGDYGYSGKRNPIPITRTAAPQ